MSDQKRAIVPLAFGPAGSPEPLAAGEVMGLSDDDRFAIVSTRAGQVVEARIPQHVDVAWLRAAVACAPVEAAVSEVEGPLGVVLRAVFPGEAHRGVLVPHRVITAGETVTLACGAASLTLQRSGQITLAGADVVSIRGRRINLN